MYSLFYSVCKYVASSIVDTWQAVNKVRVCNSKYEPTSMNDLMRSVKHLTQVLIVGVYCVDRSRKFADSDVMTFPVKLWSLTVHVSQVVASYSIESCCCSGNFGDRL